MRVSPVNFISMDLDDLSARKPDDPLVLLVRQDLDPFSVDELEFRVSVLEQEISRTKGKISASVNHRASADALFKR
jgi:uncharacterized small protein (DUF1192 family)